MYTRNDHAPLAESRPHAIKSITPSAFTSPDELYITSDTKPSGVETDTNCTLGGVIVAVGEADALKAGVRDNEAVLVTDGDACADVSDDADVDAVTNTLNDDVTLIDVVMDGSPLTLDVSKYDTEGVTENDTLLESVNELDAVDVMLAAGLSLTDTLPVLVNVTVIEIDAVPVTLLLPDMDADADGVLDDVIDTVGESVPVDVGVAVFVVDGVSQMVNDGVAVALDVAV